MNLEITTKLKLNNNVNIPLFGLGTYLSASGLEVENAVKTALDVGYRHIDTARFYHNEESIGKAIREYSLPRKEVFLTTKLWNTDHGYEKAINAFHGSLRRLDIEYVDLFLIHWPVEKLRNETWKALEEVYKEGYCKAIGVSNYTINHLKELLEICEIKPTVNQVEFHPFLYQKELLDYCRKNDIILEGYSPFAKGQRINDSKITTIAQKYNKTNAQIIIRWHLQHNVVVIPKSARKSRIIENSEVYDFVISDEDMNYLDSLNENFRCTWDPTNVP
ncbi:MAG: aldo/keto reductase [Candidatus Heimdallarchaeaceae archaeon]|jgi:diketogulonate reductase-like aldo/keto reductase